MNVKEIDIFLKNLDNATDDDNLRELFSSYSAPFNTSIPSDPFSDEYRTSQLELYRQLAGKTYSTSNEKSEFDVDECAVNPFPYRHGSAALVGDQLMAIGFFIKALNLPRGSRVLEFGPGWGNITLALAKMGHQVTAVDIESNFTELIRKRALMEKLDIELIKGDFSYIHSVTKPYDAIIFFECFHHAADHLSVMSGFSGALKAGGIVGFAAEPITDDYPIPWGLRMDGQSLWAIRKHGWLELGFNKKYFSSALARFGWSSTTHAGNDGPMSNAIIAKRANEWDVVYHYESTQLQHNVGVVTSKTLQTDGHEEGYIAYGPYLEMPEGTWLAEIKFDPTFQNSGVIFMDAVAEGGTRSIASEKQFNLNQKLITPCRVYFKTTEQLNLLEIRIRCNNGTKVRINGIQLKHI